MAVRIDMITIKGIIGYPSSGGEQPTELSRRDKEKIVADCVKQVLKTIGKTDKKRYGSFSR